MPQIAQQDYLKVNIEDYFQDVALDELSGETMTREFWDILENYRKHGTLLDVILAEAGGEARIVSYAFSDEFNELRGITYVFDAVVYRLVRPE